MRPSLILAACLALAAPAARAADNAGTIFALEAEVNRAYAANDTKTYFGFYADDLRALFPDGPSTLAAYRTDWEKMIKAGGKVEHFTYTDMHVQMAPGADAAVASYVADVKVIGPDGKPTDNGKFYETDVWFKRGGAWKIVETHYSKAP